MLIKNNRNIVQTASVPSCVLLLAPELRNSKEPKRNGTAREKLFTLQSIADKTKKKEKNGPGGEKRRSGPALILLSVAKPLTQFTNVSMGITILYCVFWTVYCVLCTVNGLVCAVNCVLCAVNSVLCTVYCVLCTVHYEQCTVRYELFTVNCVLCSLNCVLFTVKCVLFILYSV